MNSFIATISGTIATLTPEESWHCAKVLRKRPGDAIAVIDGKGNFYKAQLSLVHEKKCEAKITEGPVEQTKRNYYFHLAIAPTKQIDRIEWMIEKAVEIGIDEISFIQCKNSERVVLKHDRILKIVESAVKQSLQAFIPKVNELVSFKDFISSGGAHQKFIAHCIDDSKLEFKTQSFTDKSTLILVGPEGDFTKEEVDAALKNNFVPVSLGETRLRTETAGLYAVQCAAILA